SVTGKLINNGGQVSPGASPGILTINGDYTQGPNGVLNIEIAGTTPGSQYDRLVVTGAAALAGTLTVSFLNGFTPSASDSFKVLQFASRTGTFDKVTSTGGGREAAAYSDTDVTVTAGLLKVFLPLIKGK